MDKMDRLKISALRSTKARGHTMGVWQDWHGVNGAVSHAICYCLYCQAWVQTLRSPAANMTDIAGPAVAIGCTYQTETRNYIKLAREALQNIENILDTPDNLRNFALDRATDLQDIVAKLYAELLPNDEKK